MPRNFFLLTIVFWLLCTISTGVHAQSITLPPLTNPPSNITIPGKFVWADLFSADVDGSKRFYQQLFGWQWQDIDDDIYSIAYADERPIAGLVSRPQRPGATAGARWIYYASSSDVYAAATAVEAAGGRILVDPKTIAERGDYAIVADQAGALFGMLRSSSGDPDDVRADPNHWIWIQLLTPDTTTAVEFYRNLLGYEIYPRETAIDSVTEQILASGGYARAGITHMRNTSDTNRPQWIAFIRVADITASVDQARELGAEITLPPAADLLEGKVAIITDPSGADIGLLEWQYPEDEEG